jgi:phenylpropionate dioxygenase-like ring-hydroxylating dioxygenase large terminal subunit
MIDDYPRLLNHWYVLCQSSQLRGKPLARTVLGRPVVLFRGLDGRAAALADRCPHRNAPLSAGWVQAGRVVCPYHGWQFDGAGACELVPGLCGESRHPARDAAAVPVVEQDGLVWACPGEAPAAGPARLPYLDRQGYTHFIGEAALEGSLPDAIENFLDGTHTHFVHSGLIRTDGRRKPVNAIVRRRGAGVEAEYPDEGRQSGLISRLFGAGVDDVFGRFSLPSIAQLEYRARGVTRLLITLCFTPEAGDALRVHAVVAGQAPPFTGWLAAALIKPLFLQAFRQDRRIVALQNRNLKRFGGEQYVYTELDLLRPHIVRLLKHGPFSDEDDFEKRVQMMM